jgi:alpha-galactosidase
MGFNSWNYYHCNIDEQSVMRTADAFIANGMANVGYKV